MEQRFVVPVWHPPRIFCEEKEFTHLFFLGGEGEESPHGENESGFNNETGDGSGGTAPGRGRLVWQVGVAGSRCRVYRRYL